MSRIRGKYYKTRANFAIFHHPYDLKTGWFTWRYNESEFFRAAVIKLSPSEYDLFFFHHLEHYLQPDRGPIESFWITR